MYGYKGQHRDGRILTTDDTDKLPSTLVSTIAWGAYQEVERQNNIEGIRPLSTGLPPRKWKNKWDQMPTQEAFIHI